MTVQAWLGASLSLSESQLVKGCVRVAYVRQCVWACGSSCATAVSDRVTAACCCRAALAGSRFLDGANMYGIGNKRLVYEAGLVLRLRGVYEARTSYSVCLYGVSFLLFLIRIRHGVWQHSTSKVVQ